MNDFTIGELAILKHVLNVNSDGYKDPELLNKLQTLIDNYCEHEWISYAQPLSCASFNSELEAAIRETKCKKCGVEYK